MREFFDENKSYRKDSKHTLVDSTFYADSEYGLYFDSNALLLTRIDSVSVKKARNYASRIMCSKKFLVANVF
jgi:hypothetical protein